MDCLKEPTRKRKQEDENSQPVGGSKTQGNLKKGHKRHKKNWIDAASNAHVEDNTPSTIDQRHAAVSTKPRKYQKHRSHSYSHSEESSHKHMNKKKRNNSKQADEPDSKPKSKTPEYDEKKRSLSTETKLLQKLAGIQETGKSVVSATTRRKNVFRMEDNVENDGADDVDPEKAEMRKKKREKRKQRKLNKQKVAEGADENSGAGKDNAVSYLHQWDTERSDWKFQKVRQVWLLQNMFNQDLVSDADFEVMLRYLQELKGKSRETTATKAEKLLKEVQETEENKETYKVERTRSVIQLLC